MSEHYRPSCGTEGAGFAERFCANCTRDRRGAKNGGCQILLRTLMYDVEDADYPSEWRFDSNGEPTCTAFKDKADRKKPERKQIHGLLLT